MKSRFNESGNEYKPETMALGLGYDSLLSEGAIKPPIFLTSTFKFKNAEEGKHFFELAYGLKEKTINDKQGLVYSRLNNPNLEIFEERIAAWDKAESASVFASGMAAISTSMMAFLNPGDHIICTLPIYGGSYFLFKNILPKYNINIHMVEGGSDSPRLIKEKILEIGEDNLRMLYLETPGNPSNTLVDIEAISNIAKNINNNRTSNKVLTVVDNTFLGPVFQRPVLQGADLVIYSATKFIGGHSDLIAGVITGTKGLIEELNIYRTILGTMAPPFTGWLLLRSLETLSIRMMKQAENAQSIAELLVEHPRVKKVNYPGLLKQGDLQKEIFDKQCTGAGALIAFEIDGGEKEAFRVLNNFKIYGLAVSLGGTESLVEHPMTMTHADVPSEQLEQIGVTAGVIRVSVGIEHITDLKEDMLNALSILD